jgi:hypothetical protein
MRSSAFSFSSLRTVSMSTLAGSARSPRRWGSLSHPVGERRSGDPYLAGHLGDRPARLADHLDSALFEMAVVVPSVLWHRYILLRDASTVLGNTHHWYQLWPMSSAYRPATVESTHESPGSSCCFQGQSTKEAYRTVSDLEEPVAGGRHRSICWLTTLSAI